MLDVLARGLRHAAGSDRLHEEKGISLGKERSHRVEGPGHGPGDQAHRPRCSRSTRPAFAQDAQVMTDRRLRQPERFGEVADAGLALRLRLDQAEES